MFYYTFFRKDVRNMKKLIAFALVLVLVVTLCATAFAAKPSATLYSQYKNQSVKRGKTVKWVYKLKSGSYTKKYGQWRASFDMYILKGSIYGTQYAYGGVYFTGTYNKGYQWKVPKYTTPKGTYYNLYGTSYLKNGSWRVSTANKTKLYVK